jgi:hypothetical protein
MNQVEGIIMDGIFGTEYVLQPARGHSGLMVDKPQVQTMVLSLEQGVVVQQVGCY